MRKLVLGLFFISLIAVSVFAISGEKVLTHSYSAAQNMGTYTYNASSVTATQVTLQEDGKGCVITNANAFTIWVCTYAATSGVYDLGAGKSVVDDLQPYASYWWVLGGAGQATSTVDVIEKWGK